MKITWREDPLNRNHQIPEIYIEGFRFLFTKTGTLAILHKTVEHIIEGITKDAADKIINLIIDIRLPEPDPEPKPKIVYVNGLPYREMGSPE